MSTISIPKQKKHRHDQDFIKRSTGEKVFNVVNIVLMLILLCFFLFPVFIQLVHLASAVHDCPEEHE